MSRPCAVKGEPCLIEDCDGVACNYRGWCWKHYTAWRRHGDPLANGRRVVPVAPDGGGRRCNVCNEMLPWSEFYADTRDGSRRGSCKRCIQAEARRRYNEDSSPWRQARRTRRLRQFGITVERYDRMLAAQDGGCALCGGRDDDRALAIDHDHATGAVRSLLCGPCNLALGQVEAMGQEWLARALGYLAKHAGQQEGGASERPA